MKTELEIIDELGEWLCRDMEKALAKQEDYDGYRGPISTYGAAERQNIKNVADRIQYYKTNCLDR